MAWLLLGSHQKGHAAEILFSSSAERVGVASGNYSVRSNTKSHWYAYLGICTHPGCFW